MKRRFGDVVGGVVADKRCCFGADIVIIPTMQTTSRDCLLPGEEIRHCHKRRRRERRWPVRRLGDKEEREEREDGWY